MIRLLTLGGLSVESKGVAPATDHLSLQGLALLARLAVAGNRGLSRDKLTGCFWPERDERRARHSLSQTLHRIRRELNGNAFVLGTTVLRLNAECITSDVGEFEDVVRARQAARAVELYTGVFLDGIFVGGGAESDEWIESERRRLAEAHAGCIRQLAREAEKGHEYRVAATLWRRLTLADPLDGDAVLALAEALDAAGDHATALREVKAHEATLRAELEADLDPALKKFVAEARPARCSAPIAPTVSELCARGRQYIHGFTMAGYAEAERCFERAVSIDPSSAEAHVAHGAMLILLSQADPRGDPRTAGRTHCERAIELDPELAEPHLWLGCAAMLDQYFDEAEAHAERGFALDPDVFFSHHLVAWVYMVDALTTGNPDKFARCIEEYRRAVAIFPDEQGALTSIGGLYAFDGQYDQAESFYTRALNAERSPVGVRMIGARTLLGSVQLRHGRFAIAEANLERALAEYADAPQMFASYVNALTLCALGDARRFEGRYDEAVSKYARGCALLELMPGQIGAGYLMVRLQTRLATAYDHLWMRREELHCAERALELTRTRAGYTFSWCWLTSEAELHYDWAVYHATVGKREEMLASLGNASALGWRETDWPDVEPAFGAYRTDEEFKKVLAGARSRTPLPLIVIDDTVAAQPG